jgi:amino acid adenylation domain-containing protein
MHMNETKIEDSYVLTPMQEAMLFQSLFAPHAGMYVRQMIFSMRESINLLALKRAWQAVIQRHGSLRTKLRWENLEVPVQEVLREVEVPFDSQDWRGASPAEQQRRLEQFLALDRRRGFSLTEAPLIRLALIRFGNEDYRLIWTFHHVISDGRSDVLVSKEVFAHYEAFCEGKELQLPDAPSYRNYGAGLRQQDTSLQESFWRRRLSGFTTPTYIAPRTTSEDAGNRDNGRAEKSLRLSQSDTTALEVLAQEHGLTLNTLLQGVWALLLSRYTEEDEVVFGVIKSCRRSALAVQDSDFVVGPFINTLPMRVRVAPQMSVLEWLKELRTQWTSLRDYDQTPLQNVQDWSELSHDVPLFDSIITFERRLMNSTLKAQVNGWDNRELRTIQARTNFPLTIAAYGEEELLVVFNYDPLELQDARVERMIGHMRQALESVLSDPRQRLSDVSILTAAEQHRLVVEWNQTKSNYLENASIHELFEQQAEATPNAIAVVFEKQRLTYAELNARANQLSHYLRDLGIRPGMLVGLMLNRSVELVAAILGVLKSGAAYLPLDRNYPPERLSFMLEDADVELLLTDQHLDERQLTPGLRTVQLDEAFKECESRSTSNLCLPFLKQVCYVLYTSGSTGRPKAVLCHHAGVVNLLTWAQRSHSVSPGDKCSFWTSASFDVSLYEQFSALLFGGELHIVPDQVRIDAAKFIEWLHDQKIQCAYVPPFMGQELAGWLAQDAHTLCLKTLQTGVEPINEQILAAIKLSNPQVAILNGYGPTETAIFSTFLRFDPQSASNQNASIGGPVDNTQIYLLDQSLRLVPEGTPGEIYIGGDGLAYGYFRRPDLTAERFIPDPYGPEPGRCLYKTGDIARYLPDGNIEFIGRIDHQVKLRGHRIELGEIEAILKQFEEVSEAAVVIREKGNEGKHLVAYLALRHRDKLDLDSLRSYLREHLPEYMVPHIFVVLDNLPLTPNSKVDRKALPAPDFERTSRSETLDEPRTEVEVALCGIWCHVLGLAAVGVQDRFFDLGGHSLQLAQVVSKVRDVFQVELDIRKVFKMPTVADLAAMIEDELVKEVEDLSDEEVEFLLKDQNEIFVNK